MLVAVQTTLVLLWELFKQVFGMIIDLVISPLGLILILIVLAWRYSIQNRDSVEVP